jgi:hypothetical protein
MSTVTEYGNAWVIDKETEKIYLLRTGDVIVVDKILDYPTIYLAEDGTEPMTDSDMLQAAGMWR